MAIDALNPAMCLSLGLGEIPRLHCPGQLYKIGEVGWMRKSIEARGGLKRWRRGCETSVAEHGWVLLWIIPVAERVCVRALEAIVGVRRRKGSLVRRDGSSNSLSRRDLGGCDISGHGLWLTPWRLRLLCDTAGVARDATTYPHGQEVVKIPGFIFFWKLLALMLFAVMAFAVGFACIQLSTVRRRASPVRHTLNIKYDQHGFWDRKGGC